MRGKMMRLLLIDNPVYHSPNFLRMLQEEGNYEVSLVTSQADYEANSRRDNIALFADLKIPGREATNEEPWNSALAKIKALREKGLPVLVLRTFYQTEAGEQATALGAGVLKKPLEISEILENLKEMEPKEAEEIEVTAVK